MDIEDRLEDIGFWVMVPTIRLTENHPRKMVRVLGVLLAMFLLPLSVPLAMVFMIPSMIVGMYRMI